MIKLCGIIGYIGTQNASEILVKGLKHLEYRGYDSVGVATATEEGIDLRKDEGMIENVAIDLGFTSMNGHIGIGHCLHPNTRVQLSDGTVCRIKEVKNNDIVSTLDFGSLKFSGRSCAIMRHPSPPELYEIRTSANSLVCTGGHKMFVANGGAVAEKMVSQLQKGDLLICSSAIRITGVPQKLADVSARRYYAYDKSIVEDFRQFLKKNGWGRREAACLIGVSEAVVDHFLNMDRNLEERYLNKICTFSGIKRERFRPVDSIHGKNIHFPGQTSEELLQFIGYFAGDGYAGKRHIRFKDTRKDVLEKYSRLAKKLFNLNSRIIKLKEADAYLLEMNSKFICDWVRLNFSEICKRGRKKSIPLWLGRVPDEHLRGFIKGLFDAECACGMHSHQLSLRMTNKDIIQTMQFFLLRFGILSSFRRSETKWGPSYSLSINTADDLSKFIEHVGLSSMEKRAKLQQMLSKMKPGISYTYKPLPMRKGEIRQAYGIKSGLLGGGQSYLTNMTAHALMVELGEENSEIAAKLKRYLDSDVIFQEMTDIRKIPSDTEFVYDIEVPGTKNFVANCLISHNSRWATHGAPCKVNAHPHFDTDKSIVLVHNGVVENYLEIKEELAAKGHKFVSDTDSEVIAHLMEEQLKTDKPFYAFIKSLRRLKGSYGLVVMFKDDKEHLYIARKGSPLIIGVGKGEMFCASDIPAMLNYTKTFVPLEDGDVATISKNGYKISDIDGKPVERKSITVDWNMEMAEKGGYNHFMLKEINDQRHFINETLATDISAAKELVDKYNRIHIIACGTSYHAGLLLSYLLMRKGKEARAFIASDYQFIANPDENTLVIAITQSGETADVLQALKFAKEKKVKIAGITNVVGSSITRIADAVVYLNVGPEIGVAATKTFMAQLVVAYMLVYPKEKLAILPTIISNMLEKENEIKEIAAKLKDAHDVFFIGRGLSVPIAYEGSLKFKEISYIHSEAYPGGELKHGTLSLIEKGIPLIAIAPDDETAPKMFGNLKETKSRGAMVVSITDNAEIKKESDYVIELPKIDKDLYPFAEIVPLQLLAYHVSVLKGNNPDKPRNLAKSVTVE